MAAKKAAKNAAPTEPEVPAQNNDPKFPADGSILPTESSIPLQNQINTWINDSNRKWRLIWKASRSNYDIGDFHRTCDGVGETVTLIRVKKSNVDVEAANETATTEEDPAEQAAEDDSSQSKQEQKQSLTNSHHIFGGYLKQMWHSQNQWIRDPEAFIFYLDDSGAKVEEEAPPVDPKAKGKKGGKASKDAPDTEAQNDSLGEKFIPLVPEQAALGRSTQGPSFGRGDLYISPFSDCNNNSSSTLGVVYGIRSQQGQTIASKMPISLLGGETTRFVVDEIEVFTKSEEESQSSSTQQESSAEEES